MFGLPLKTVGIVLGALALLAALVYGVGHLLSEERKAGAAVVAAQWQAANAQQQATLAKVQGSLSDGLASVDTHLQSRLAGLTQAGTSTNTTLVKEIHDAPQISSSDCALSDGVWRPLAAARQLSAPSGPQTVGSGPVPTGTAAPGQAGGDAGPH